METGKQLKRGRRTAEERERSHEGLETRLHGRINAFLETEIACIDLRRRDLQRRVTYLTYGARFGVARKLVGMEMNSLDDDRQARQQEADDRRVSFDRRPMQKLGLFKPHMLAGAKQLCVHAIFLRRLTARKGVRKS